MEERLQAVVAALNAQGINAQIESFARQPVIVVRVNPEVTIRLETVKGVPSGWSVLVPDV